MSSTVTLWEFLLQLLVDGNCPDVIVWIDSNLGEFLIKDADKLAQLWGEVKKRPAMNYAKLSRGLRYYYDKGIMMKIAGKRYAYRFVKKPYMANCSNYFQKIKQQQPLYSRSVPKLENFPTDVCGGDLNLGDKWTTAACERNPWSTSRNTLVLQGGSSVFSMPPTGCRSDTLSGSVQKYNKYFNRRNSLFYFKYHRDEPRYDFEPFLQTVGCQKENYNKFPVRRQIYSNISAETNSWPQQSRRYNNTMSICHPYDKSVFSVKQRNLVSPYEIPKNQKSHKTENERKVPICNLSSSTDSINWKEISPKRAWLNKAHSLSKPPPLIRLDQLHF